MKNISIIWLLSAVLFFSATFSSIQFTANATIPLNKESTSWARSTLCQTIGLLYHLPQHRRQIMEKADGNNFEFFLAETFFLLEAEKTTAARGLRNIVSFLENEKISLNDLSGLFWTFLGRVELLEDVKNIRISPFELACFTGTNRAKRVQLDSLDSLGKSLQENKTSEYVIALFHSKTNLSDSRYISWTVNGFTTFF